MSSGRKKAKLRLCQQHRREWYDRSLERLMTGRAKPADVTYRWKLYKQVKGK